MQQYMATGRLTKEPVLTYTDKAKCTFFLAVEEKKGNHERVDYIPCVAWREYAEVLSNYLKKGSPVSVQGVWRSSMYEEAGRKRMTLELEILDCKFLT